MRRSSTTSVMPRSPPSTGLWRSRCWRRGISSANAFHAGHRSIKDAIQRGADLSRVLGKETFFRDLPAIDQFATLIDTEFKRRFDSALVGGWSAGGHLVAMLM